MNEIGVQPCLTGVIYHGAASTILLFNILGQVFGTLAKVRRFENLCRLTGPGADSLDGLSPSPDDQSAC